LLADYLPYCETVRIPPDPPEPPACRDPFDIPFLQLAVLGKADFLVTGDKDLLSLADSSSCPIVTAEQILGMLAGQVRTCVSASTRNSRPVSGAS
jgi:predicted nucleic acid-binding protein